MAKRRTQTKAKPIDATSGERALKAIEAELRAMSLASVVSPNSDAQLAAQATLALVEAAREKKCAERLALLHKELFKPSTVDDAEIAARATGFADTKVLSEAATKTSAKVDADLYEKSGTLLAKMLRLVEYHAGDDSRVQAEIQDIRRGTGYQDRVNDLRRVAALFSTWEEDIEDDPRLYEQGDDRRALEYAEQISAQIRATTLGGKDVDWADVRNRAFTRMSLLHIELKSALDFVFRNEPEELPRFLPLRAAALLLAPRKGSAKVTTTPGEAVPPPGAPPATPSPQPS